MKRICKQCGKEFELSESEVSFYQSKGLELPKRCKSCRDKNKGRSSQAQEKQKIVSTPQSSQNNHHKHNRNDKSYVVISAAAVLLVLIVFLLKSVFTVPSESVSISGDAVSEGLQAVPETPEAVPAETVQDAPSALQKPEDKDEEPPKEQISQQTDMQNDARAETKTVAAAETAGAVPETPEAAYQFRKAEYLTEHFQKHGAEFPYATEEEYLLGANNVIQNPNALHKLEAEDGDDVYYVENTGEFVIVSTDGYIRTYFIADMDYYNRQ